MSFYSTISAATALALVCLAPLQGHAAEGDIPFSKADLHAYLVGKTYPLSSGAFYFENGEKLEAVWKGKTETTTWWTTDDSRFCYNLKMFGGEECIGLFRMGDDKLVHVYDGQRRILAVSDLKDGKGF